MEVLEEMNESEQKKVAIDKYMNLLRIEKYGQEEFDFQKRAAKVELQILGIPTEELEADTKEKTE